MHKDYRRDRYTRKQRSNRHRGQGKKKKWRNNKQEKLLKKRRTRKIIRHHIAGDNHGVVRFRYDEAQGIFVNVGLNTRGGRTSIEIWEITGCDCQGYHSDGVEVCDAGAWNIRNEAYGSCSVSLQNWKI